MRNPEPVSSSSSATHVAWSWARFCTRHRVLTRHCSGRRHHPSQPQVAAPNSMGRLRMRDSDRFAPRPGAGLRLVICCGRPSAPSSSTANWDSRSSEAAVGSLFTATGEKGSGTSPPCPAFEFSQRRRLCRQGWESPASISVAPARAIRTGDLEC
eukprot:6801979-Prymnesium_polylepis.2